MKEYGWAMVEPMLVGERMRNMIVQVCIGSACHLKGSYDVIKTMQRVIEEDDLKNKVILKVILLSWESVQMLCRSKWMKGQWTQLFLQMQRRI